MAFGKWSSRALERSSPDASRVSSKRTTIVITTTIHPSPLPASPAPRGSIPAKSWRGAGGRAEWRRPADLARAELFGSPNREVRVPKFGDPQSSARASVSLGVPHERHAAPDNRMLRHRHHAALPHSRGIQKRAHSGPALAATSKAGGKHVARTSAGRTLPQPAGQPRRKWQQASTCAWRCSSCVPLLSSPLAHTHVCPLARVCRRPLMSSTSPS